ncbi:MAG: peptidylprolyl isomerase [Acidobacteria bacterium]|nr:peptidylprolyl isomerase [Acidobacteriota bacterium]
MNRTVVSCCVCLAFLPVCFPAAAHGRYGPREAVRAEWARQDPGLGEGVGKALSPEDRDRLELSLRRIGKPGMPPMLPPELDQPALADWEQRALRAKSPQDRFTALHFLNRLKSPKSLSALAGLAPADAAAWPRHLQLSQAVAAARLRGEKPDAALTAFLEALDKAGKVDPVRAAAARLRLHLAGIEPVPPSGVVPTPGAVAALLEAWNRGPWDRRVTVHLDLLLDLALPGMMISRENLDEHWRRLGLSGSPDYADPAPVDAKSARAGNTLREFLMQRLLEGLPDPLDEESNRALSAAWRMFTVNLPNAPRLLRLAWAGVLPRAKGDWAAAAARGLAAGDDPIVRAYVLPALRKLDPSAADTLRKALLAGKDPVARGAAIEDLPAPPEDLAALCSAIGTDNDLDGLQALIGALERWKLAPERQAEVLGPFRTNPDWARRFLAWQALVKIRPDTPWPAAPDPTPRDRQILKKAESLAAGKKPVRLRVTFSGNRSVVLRLDPKIAPLNTANLILLASEGFFDGRRVPRVVPDFVVQMGSPWDTMDGGPGYTVRCENSLTWYGPGSVGMALSGKDTGGSQFFITTNATPHLTGRYTRVGEVEDPDKALPILDGLIPGTLIVSVNVEK